MQIYNFSGETGEFLSEGVADESPLDPGNFLLPAYSTTIAPPPTGSRECAIFSSEADRWRIVPDYRGVLLFDVTTGASVALGKPGVLPSDVGLTEQVPPDASLPSKWDGTTWVIDVEAQGAAARAKRDGLLAACDWTVLPDAPLSAADKTAWKTYRQALRDIPAQAGFPAAIDWPVAP